MASREDSSERHVTRAKFDNPLLSGGAKLHVALPRIEISVERIAGLAMDEHCVFDGDVYRIGSHPSNDLVPSFRSCWPAWEPRPPPGEE